MDEKTTIRYFELHNRKEKIAEGIQLLDEQKKKLQDELISVGKEIVEIERESLI